MAAIPAARPKVELPGLGPATSEFDAVVDLGVLGGEPRTLVGHELFLEPSASTLRLARP